MNNITTTTTHSALPTTGTMSPPAPTTRPTAPSQICPASSAASKSWYSAPSAPAPTMIGPSRPKRMPAGRHVMIGGLSSPTSTLSQAPSAGQGAATEQSQQRLNNSQHMSTRAMNQSMPTSAQQATTGSSYGNPSYGNPTGSARTEKVDMPRA